MKPPFYCFCFGFTGDIAKKSNQLGMRLNGDDNSGYFLCDGSSSWFGNAVNSISTEYREDDDYIKQSHAGFGETGFIAKTDYWGMRPHFYYHEGHTFICSNNLLLVSILSGAKKICRESMLDSLLMIVPQKGRTWLEDIRVTVPGEQIKYSIEENSIEIIRSVSSEELASVKTEKPGSHQPIAESYARYSDYCMDQLSELPVSISLSYGSDSRTALALIRNKIPRLTAYTFGDEDMVELEQVRSLSSELKLNHRAVSFSEAYADFRTRNLYGSVTSSFYMNPFRVHYLTLYNSMKGNRANFEGVLGSEFIKAELASNVMVSSVQTRHLQGLELDQAVRKIYGDTELSDEIIEHGRASQADYWNSDDRRKSYAEWALGNIPSFIFGPIYSFLHIQGIAPFAPFLDRDILASVFRNGFGITSYNSVLPEHPGPIRDVVPEAIAAKYNDPEIYRTRLSRYFSFRECMERNNLMLKGLIHLRRIVLKRRSSDLSLGQIKKSVINNAYENFMEGRKFYFPPSENPLIRKVNGIAASMEDAISDQERVCEIIAGGIK